MKAAEFEIIVAKKFWEKVPPEYIARTLAKMRRVERDIASGGRVGSSRKFSAVTPVIFKRRVGQNFRISFQYFDEPDRRGIQFIAFTSHDAQVRKHRRIPASSLERMRRERSRRLQAMEEKRVRTIQAVPPGSLESGEAQPGGPAYAYPERMFERLDEYRRNCGNAGAAFCNELLHVLDSEQAVAAGSNHPNLILTGCAGSGKSLVGLKWLQQYRREGRVLYLTLSQGLCEEIARKQTEYDHFNRYCLTRDGREREFQPAPQFYPLHDWLSQQASDDSRRWLEADPGSSLKRFERWYLGPHNWNKARKAGVKNFTPLDVWAEIRGVIKGHMGLGFLRSRSFTADSRESRQLDLDRLKELGLVEQQGKSWLIPAEGPGEKFSWSRWGLDDAEWAGEEMVNLGDRVRRHLFDEPLLPLAMYLRLRDDCSRFERPERELIHAIAVEYQNWLAETGQADDSDLARTVLWRLAQGDKPVAGPYRAIFVDEVQDLTELQIFALLLSSPGSRMMFAVDQQQIIHPTYYQTGRLEEALRHSGREASTVVLRKNWRCTKELVDLQNLYIGLRNREESLSAEERQPVIAAGGHGARAVWIEAGEENEQKLLKIAAKHMMRLLYHKTAPDDLGTGLELIKNKGMEFSLAMAWKVMADTAEAWRTIDLDKSRRGPGERSRLCYAMNYFYVAITRARETLLILESSRTKGAEWLRQAEQAGLCEYWADVDGARLERLLNQISFEERLREARQFETLQAPNWLEAAKTYRFIERADDVLRCEAMIDKENQRFDAAVEKFLGMKTIDKNFADFSACVAACQDERLWIAGRMHQEQAGSQTEKGLRGVEKIRGEWRRKFPAAKLDFAAAMLQAARTYPEHVLEAYLAMAQVELRNIRSVLCKEIDEAQKNAPVRRQEEKR